VIPDSAAEKPDQGRSHRRRQRQDHRQRRRARARRQGRRQGLFGKYSGTEVKLDGEELLVMREDDIMAVIEG
jgi:chaperonin GroES